MSPAALPVTRFSLIREDGEAGQQVPRAYEQRVSTGVALGRSFMVLPSLSMRLTQSWWFL